jgi:hypothetical protein
MPTQHEQLITFITNFPNQTTDFIIRRCFNSTIPASTVRARLAELRRSGRLVNDDSGWRIPSDVDSVENLYEEQRIQNLYEEQRIEDELEEAVRNQVKTTSRKPILIAKKNSCEQRINRIGVEIEGGWDEDNYPDEHHHDGSVSVDGHLVGESCSIPLRYEEVENWVCSNYPDHINKSCGMHVHFSFSNELAYLQLMDSKFYNKVFLPNIEQWGLENGINEGSSFWQRLKGLNDFCRKGFRGEKQSRCSSKEQIRYYHLNYCYSLRNPRRTATDSSGNRYSPPMKTIEVRLFPMFKKRDDFDRPILALKAIECLYNLFNNYLAIQKPEPQTVHNIDVNYDEEILEETICV